MSEFTESIYRHATYSVTKAWRERQGRYRLIGSRCARCGERFFPHRFVCPACGHRELEPYACCQVGEVVCYWPPVSMVVMLGHEDAHPRLVGIIRLDDGIHVEGEFVDATEAEVQPGARVRMVLRKQRRESNGNWMYGFKFAPLKAYDEG